MKNKSQFQGESKPEPRLPHSIEAERALLAACMRENAPEVIEAATEAGLREDSFYRPAHRNLYAAISALQAEGTEIDEISVEEKLYSMGLLEETGGRVFINEVSESVGSTAMFRNWIEIVTAKALQRQTIRKGQMLIEAASGADFNPADVAATLREMADDTVSTDSGIRDWLKTIRFDPKKHPPSTPPILTFNGVEVSHPGNLCTLTAAPGVGKTALLCAGMATSFSANEVLGWKSPIQEGAVVHIDTEQSRDDAFTNSMRTLRRAGLKEDPRFLSFPMVGTDPTKVYNALRIILADALKEFGAIHSVWIDGTGDLAFDVNDPAEAQKIVSGLHGMANDHNTVIWSILHFNPGGDKMRGHLGSYLERKSETVLRMEKESDGETAVIYSAKTRRAPIPKNHGVRIKWNSETQMHEREEGVAEQKAQANLEDAVQTALELAGGDPWRTWKHGELVEDFCKLTAKSEETAKRFIRKNRGQNRDDPSAIFVHNAATGSYNLGVIVRDRIGNAAKQLKMGVGKQ